MIHTTTGRSIRNIGRRSRVIKFPFCSRYGNHGDYMNERVRATYEYALSLMENSVEYIELIASVYCLHDHKGTLHVVSRRELPDYCVAMLSVAWVEAANECLEAVEFHVLPPATLDLMDDPSIAPEVLASVVAGL